MISFATDYLVGCTPEILKRLEETNMEVQTAYGYDAYAAQAAEKIRAAANCPDAQIWFVSGGTECNQLVIGTHLKSYQGVVAAKTGHVAVHEAGAIEYTGHKVMELEGKDGKLVPEELAAFLRVYMADGNITHMVQPGMVYISQPTELGTLYSKAELTAIYDICKQYGLPLYIDGARLGYALGSRANDISLEELCRLCDIFYIGGTKCGALIGEALVFTHGNMPSDFFTLMKQRGVIVAKGRVLSLQFDVLFTDGLYEKLGRHAMEMAYLLVDGLKAKGYRMYLDSPTNQQFVVIENSKMEELRAKKVDFSFIEHFDDSHTVIRFCTCWATQKSDVEELLSLL